jgi:hypothetical protein
MFMVAGRRSSVADGTALMKRGDERTPAWTGQIAYGKSSSRRRRTRADIVR